MEPDDPLAGEILLAAGTLAAARDPLVALKAVHAGGAAAVVIETATFAVDGHADRCLWRFGDDGWIPTRAGLEGLCRAAGFARTELVEATGDGLVLRAWR